MSDFNSFEAVPKCIKEDPKFQLKQPVTYILCSIRKENVYDFNTGQTTERTIIPTAHFIDAVYGYTDPNTLMPYTLRYVIGQKTVRLENGGDMVVPVIGNINFTRKAFGQMTLDPNNHLHQILYPILECHPLNEKNSGGANVFRRIDHEMIANEESKKEMVYFTALEKCHKMKDKELDDACKGFLLDFGGMPLDKVDRREKVIALVKIARNNPDLFLEKLKSINFSYISIIRDAELLKIISFNTVKDAWVYDASGEILHAKMPALDKYDSFVEWVKQNNKGEIALQKLKADIEEKNKK